MQYQSEMTATNELYSSAGWTGNWGIFGGYIEVGTSSTRNIVQTENPQEKLYSS